MWHADDGYTHTYIACYYDTKIIVHLSLLIFDATTTAE